MAAQCMFDPSSFAKKRKSGGAREYLFRAQGIACVGETRDNIVVWNARIILQDIGFASSVGRQSDHEFDRKSRPANSVCRRALRVRA